MGLTHDKWAGLLWGTAVGDALGLPAEGLSPKRARALFPRPWRHRLLPGTGMISDDTEHTLFVAQCLLRHPKNVSSFLKRLAWCLRLWLLLLPAGVGLATARACVRLWFCISPQKSGIYSAGNGPAMRVAPIGAFFAHNRGLLDQYVAASTLLTHTDPKALTAARAVALVTALAAVQDERPSLAKYLDLLTQAGQDEDWQHLLTKLDGSLQQAQSTVAFAKTLGLERGVSGYSYHTVPVVLHAVYRYWHDFESGLIAILACGGDADTTAAIGGAILGTIHGKQGIPLHWRNGLRDWPRGARYFDALANSLAQGGSPVRYPWWGVLPRNICFLKIVLAHGLRRLLPPY